MDIAMRRRRDGLLITESRKEFAQRRKGLTDQIGPMGPVEHEYADDFAYNRWETDRFRRLGAAVLNSAFVPALENILKQLLGHEDFETHLDLERAAEDLARRYFHDREAKTEVSSCCVNLVWTKPPSKPRDSDYAPRTWRLFIASRRSNRSEPTRSFWFWPRSGRVRSHACSLIVTAHQKMRCRNLWMQRSAVIDHGERTANCCQQA
jgi:hypothetical protein